MNILLASVFNLLIIFLVKVFDNILSTSKTILIQKNRSILAGITVIIDQIIFYKLINIVSDSEIAIYVISVASGLGTILAVLISNKFSKDKMYVNVILSDDKESMQLFREFLKDNRITNLATIGYTKEWDQSIAITAYAQTKYESKLIDNYLSNEDIKYKRIIQKQ